MKKGLIIQILTYAVPIILLLYIINVVLKRFGLVKTGKEKREDKATEEKALNLITSEYFNPLKHQNASSNWQRLSPSQVRNSANAIKRAVWGWATNEVLIYTTFKKLYNKMNISEVSDEYYSKYKEDMMTDIANDLNTKEMAILSDIIKSLPNN